MNIRDIEINVGLGLSIARRARQVSTDEIVAMSWVMPALRGIVLAEIA